MVIMTNKVYLKMTMKPSVVFNCIYLCSISENLHLFKFFNLNSFGTL